MTIKAVYERERSWSDEYIPAMIEILQEEFGIEFEQATDEQDMKESTDLISLVGEDHRVGCRIRRSSYADRYPHEFTIRNYLESGNETEFKKILMGNGDFMLYGFAGEGGKLKSWKILNLNVFRETIWDEYRRRKVNEPRKVTEQKIRNHDGTGFLAFDVRDFPAGLVVASG